MSTKTEAIVFENRGGSKLFGTLHTPDNTYPDDPMIVLLSPGVKMRVGPHGLYNRMTEFLNALGFSVFKFDFFGLGDSEGEIDREFMAEIYLDTQTGIFVEDAVDALDWLQGDRGTSSFIVGGLCGGAITGLLLAKEDHRVNGLLSLGIPTTLEMGASSRQKYATRGELAELRKGYVRRLLQPQSWVRLVTFQSDFRTILKSVGQLFTTRKSPVAPNSNESSRANSAPNTNPYFGPAFFKVAQDNCKHLLIFSERDRLYWEFEEKFADLHREELANLHKAFDLHVVKEANHIFSFREWEKEMLDIVGQWLKDKFLERLTVSTG